MAGAVRVAAQGRGRQMSETRNPTELSGASRDIAPLAWVIDEIRNSLTEAVNGLKALAPDS